MRREKKLKAALKLIVERLIRFYKPEKIILFGSIADGKVRRWSDIDLLIIKKTTKRVIKRLQEASQIADARVGLDLMVYTPEEFQKGIDAEHYFVYGEIFKKGKVLYDRKRVAGLR